MATIASARVVHVRAVLVPWLKEIEAAAGGRLTFRLFAGGMLGRDPGQQHWLVKTGVADIAWFTLAWEHGRFARLEEAARRLADRDSVSASRRLFRRSAALWPAEAGTRPLALFFSPPYALHLSRPPGPGGDLSGRRIRVIDRAQATLIAAHGAIPVTGLSPLVLGDALARGLIDGALLSWHAVAATGVLAASHYHLDGPFGTSVGVLVLRREAERALPSASRALFSEAAGIALSGRFATVLCEAAARARERALARGDRIVSLAPLFDRSAGVRPARPRAPGCPQTQAETRP